MQTQLCDLSELVCEEQKTVLRAILRENAPMLDATCESRLLDPIRIDTGALYVRTPEFLEDTHGEPKYEWFSLTPTKKPNAVIKRINRLWNKSWMRNQLTPRGEQDSSYDWRSEKYRQTDLGLITYQIIIDAKSVFFQNKDEQTVRSPDAIKDIIDSIRGNQQCFNQRIPELSPALVRYELEGKSIRPHHLIVRARQHYASR